MSVSVFGELNNFCLKTYNLNYNSNFDISNQNMPCHSESDKQNQTSCLDCKCYLISINSVNYFLILNENFKSSNFNISNTYFSSLNDDSKDPPPRA